MVDHPLTPADNRFSGQCPNCHMIRAMWARTWMAFEHRDGARQVCSFHCLADIAVKSGIPPDSVRSALYLEPTRMVPADTALFVVGSTARGTMSQTSKLAFPAARAAEAFVADCGGRILRFPDAFALAKASLNSENNAIGKKRRATGKIVEPADHTDECPVCFMYPARYPRHRCQIQTAEGKVHHFCSTRCMFWFLQDPASYGNAAGPPFLLWATDFVSGAWISARTAYYVVGSNRWGPMGYEAFAFDRRSDAESFQKRENGQIRTFEQIGLTDFSNDHLKP
jgi:nitrous oxide reductase accessory protein NosL